MHFIIVSPSSIYKMLSGGVWQNKPVQHLLFFSLVKNMHMMLRTVLCNAAENKICYNSCFPPLTLWKRNTRNVKLPMSNKYIINYRLNETVLVQH